MCCEKTECMTDMEKPSPDRKPIVGLLPSVDDMTGATKLSAAYTKAVLAHGGVPFLFSFLQEEADMRQLAQQCDAFLFTGGIDPDPALYGEEKLNDTVEISDCRDRLEFPLLKMALELDRPVLGICRGIQVLNVALGGSLYQDLPAQLPDDPAIDRKRDIRRTAILCRSWKIRLCEKYLEKRAPLSIRTTIRQSRRLRPGFLPWLPQTTASSRRAA